MIYAPSLAHSQSLDAYVPPPFRKHHTPSIKVDQIPGGVRIEETLDSGTTVEGIDDLVKDGTIRSYVRTREALVAYADSADAAKKVATLKLQPSPVLSGSIIDRARQLLLPPNMSETVAPEYLRFRAWSLASSVLSGAINFMGAALVADANKIAFATGANVATASFATGLVYKGTAIGSSYLAGMGDTNPKKFMLMGTMVNGANAIINVGLLAVMPKAIVPLNTFMSGTSAVANTFAGAANVNVFNHLATGDNRGIVQAKNSNQDMIADFLGAPLALGMMAGAAHFGLSPYLATVSVLGPLMLVCNVQAARELHMESLDRPSIENIADAIIDTGQAPDAPHTGLFGTLKNLFFSKAKPGDPRLRTAASMDELVNAATANGTSIDVLYGIFRHEKFLLTEGKDGGIVLTFRADADIQDYLKGFTHARLLERVLNSKIPDVMKKIGAPDRSLLMELAYRGLPYAMPKPEKLTNQGWHTNVNSLGVQEVDGAWTAPSVSRVNKVSTEQLTALIANPDEQTIRKLLNPSAFPPS